MDKDQSIGVVILLGSVLGIALYGWLLYAFPIIVLELTAFAAVGAVLCIVAWIGWTMATTPPPEPIESMIADSEGEEPPRKSAESPSP